MYALAPGAAAPLARRAVAVAPDRGRAVRRRSCSGIRPTAGRRSRSPLISATPSEWSWDRPIALYLVKRPRTRPGCGSGALLCIFYVRNALLNWTAVPLIGLLTLLDVHERVEIHWVFGGVPLAVRRARDRLRAALAPRRA